MVWTPRQSRMLGTSDGVVATAGIITIPRRVRTRQPQQSVGIDWGNPLSKGLVAAYLPSSTTNIATSKPLAITGLTKIANADGIAFNLANSTDKIADTVNGLTGASAVTFLIDGVLGVGGGGSATRYFHGGDNLFGSGLYFSNVNSSGQQLTVGYGNSGVLTSNGGASYFDNTRPRKYGISLTSGVGFSEYRDGTFFDTISTANVFNSTTLQNVVMLNRPDGTRPADTGTKFNLFLIWNRELSSAEHAAIGRNPWQIFAPDTPPIWGPA